MKKYTHTIGTIFLSVFIVCTSIFGAIVTSNMASVQSGFFEKVWLVAAGAGITIVVVIVVCELIEEVLVLLMDDLQ